MFLLPKALENPAFGFMKDLRKRSNTRTVKITKHALKEGGYRSKKIIILVGGCVHQELQTNTHPMF